MTYQLYCGDCLDILPTLAAGSVDFIMADLPYGTTAHAWDTAIDLTLLWREYKRIAKPNAAILLFGVMPFTAVLWQSNPDWWRYEYVWKKNGATRFLDANDRPLLDYENIEVFYKEQPTFNPQKWLGEPTHSRGQAVGKQSVSGLYSGFTMTESDMSGQKFPRLVVSCDKVAPYDIVHPSQKPVDLLCHFISTYTNSGETVLDNTVGSGSTGVAALKLGRNFIGIEKSEDYFKIAERRIQQADAQPALMEIP